MAQMGEEAAAASGPGEQQHSDLAAQAPVQPKQGVEVDHAGRKFFDQNPRGPRRFTLLRHRCLRLPETLREWSAF